mmetsp:Transcript_56450/g.156324  ORF Transcript_56450/g.156324 Transcript_56450/m.156324 type:complete len:208 (-) Transcript_56450:203-826(-)
MAAADATNVWDHPCVPRSIRRPWEVFAHEQEEGFVADDAGLAPCRDGGHRMAFESAPEAVREVCVGVAQMELAAFLAWLAAQACGRRSLRDVLADVGQRRGMPEEVARAWDDLADEEKGEWVPIGAEEFLQSGHIHAGRNSMKSGVIAAARQPVRVLPRPSSQRRLRRKTSYTAGALVRICKKTTPLCCGRSQVGQQTLRFAPVRQV